jgi:hypothetical protein
VKTIGIVRVDVVAFNGSSWVARKDNPGKLPGPDWQLLSSVGKRGARGPRGERGPTWSDLSFDREKLAFITRMSDGSIGNIISLRHIFADLSLDVENYSLKLTMLDGSEINFSVRGLFEQFHKEITGQ